MCDACCYCLGQCLEVVQGLPDPVYSRSAAGSSAIGVHVRHIIERVLCVLEGMETGQVDYDCRARQRLLEESPAAALRALESLKARLAMLPTEANIPLQARESVHPEVQPVAIASTLNRELMSLISHTTHHLALISLLARSRGIELAAEIGKAPSTLIHEREEGNRDRQVPDSEPG